MIESLTDIKPALSLDPTFLPTKEEWNNLSNLSQLKIEEDYLLTYFLGNAPTKEIKMFARDNKLKVINLYNSKSMDSSCLSSSIEDFLHLFSGAAYVMTDSFHGTVFSILFEKKFATFYRGDMNSRFKSLIDLLEFEDSYSSKDSIILDVNYLKTNKLLKTLIKKSKSYLVDSLQ